MDILKIKNDCIPFIEELNLSLYSLELKKDGENNILEFVIDKKGFVDIEEIEKITEKINEYLDETDPIDEDYSLSVTSRGVEKDFPFDDAEYYIGEWIEVKTMDQLHKGELLEKTNDSIIIKDAKNKKVKINANDIMEIHTVIKF